MARSLGIVALSLCSAFAASGCDGPTAPPEDTVELSTPAFGIGQGWVPLDFTTSDPCNGDIIAFSTQHKEKVIMTTDARGGFHLGYHRAWRGTGVGQSTGIVYQFNWPRQIQHYFRGPFPETFTIYIANNRVSRGSADNLVFSMTEHFTVNANGDLTSDARRITGILCVG